VARTTGGQWSDVNDNVDCPKTGTCGAKRGQQCQTRGGNKLYTPHKARIDLAAKKAAPALKAKLVALGPLGEELEDAGQRVAAQEAMDTPMVDEVTRAERLEIILVGIQLARKVGATEEQVVRALAEMVVDGDGWVALF